MYGRYDTYAKIFQSTPPVWAETVHHPFFKITKRFQSTPPVWAETRSKFYRSLAPRNFNPLRPCGRRRVGNILVRAFAGFQSTPPVWAETITPGPLFFCKGDFNPLRPCGRRHLHHTTSTIQIINFNPLRPCGRRLSGAAKSADRAKFQSTPPVWAETQLQKGSKHHH